MLTLDASVELFRLRSLVRPTPAAARLGQGRGGVGEQADPQALGFIDHLAVHFHDAIGDAQHQLAHDHALEIDDSR